MLFTGLIIEMTNPQFKTEPEILKIVQIFVRQRVLEQPEVMSEIKKQAKEEQEERSLSCSGKQTPMTVETIERQSDKVDTNTSSQSESSDCTHFGVAPKEDPLMNIRKYNLIATEAICRSIFNAPIAGYYIEEENDEIENADEIDQFIENIEEKKSFTDIDEDGWCTPWAEILDTVNIFFFHMEEDEFLEEVRKMAAKLGAGITENIQEATHIVTEYDTDITSIECMVSGV
eukprot:TRINITY_DN7184_c0_g2_i2.p1 TRINITY_DN7184_c0_g2~~TRINITY_DN7184_c0_g2_i2.p1  ORF type:complete len:231 (+),score=45.00 TRINITY_DN7184_c0_g2_i2:439-1131(+)